MPSNGSGNIVIGHACAMKNGSPALYAFVVCRTMSLSALNVLENKYPMRVEVEASSRFTLKPRVSKSD